MSESGDIPELQYNHPDGRPRTRLEMEQWFRQEVPKVHWLRIIANRVFGLPKQVSWDMKEIVLKHWLLDEMLRRQVITGDQLGVNTNNSNDDAEMRQFTTRLKHFVQTNQAVLPQHAEGIDMSNFTPPPPPVNGSPNGQPQQYAQQPPPPSGPPMGYAQPPAPSSPPPQMMQPPIPPPPQQQFSPPPQQQPQQYSQPPQPPQQQPPQMGPPPGYGGPQMGPPMGPPPQTAAPTPGRRGRKPADPGAQQQSLPMAPPPSMAPMGPPQGFAPAPYQPAPQSPPPGVPFAPAPAPNGAGMQQVSFALPATANAGHAQVDLTAVNKKLDQLLNLVAQQARKIEMLSAGVTVIGRAYYQKQGGFDLAEFLSELGVTFPQQ